MKRFLLTESLEIIDTTEFPVRVDTSAGIEQYVTENNVVLFIKAEADTLVEINALRTQAINERKLAIKEAKKVAKVVRDEVNKKKASEVTRWILGVLLAIVTAALMVFLIGLKG